MIEKWNLCRLEELPESDSKGFAFKADALYADIFIVRTRNGLYAYRNRCPHTGAPMESLPDDFMNYQKQFIQCAIHGAQFQVEDGYCWSGPCKGRYLEKIAIGVQDGVVVALEKPNRQCD